MRLSKIAAAAAILALVIPQLGAQQIVGQDVVTMAADFDLDGAAASATAIHSADQIVDSTAYTIDAQPDTPRPLQATLTDADSSITSCTLTVVGTQADGQVVTSTATLTGGSGAKALSPVYNYATVTSSSTGVCTGEAAGDLVSLGTTTTVPIQWITAWGSSTLSAQGWNVRSPFRWRVEGKTIKTSGSSTTVVSGVASSAALRFVNPGDIITFSINGEVVERAVTAKASNDSITINDPIDIVTPVSYRYRVRFFGPDTWDGWFAVNRYSSGLFVFNVDQSGQPLTVKVQCKLLGANEVPVEEYTANISTGAQGTAAINFTLRPFDLCRIGLSFQTPPDGDDTGANLEIINGWMSLGLRN